MKRPDFDAVYKDIHRGIIDDSSVAYPVYGKEKELKLYVMVRRDLPWSVRCVQAIHAVGNLAHHGLRNHNVWGKDGPPVVLLGVSGVELEEWSVKLDGVCELFREPDLGNQLTALAFVSSPLKELADMKLL